MAQTSLNITIDDELKTEFDELCESIGIPMSTAFCIFAKKAVAEQRLPLDLTSNNPVYSEKLDAEEYANRMRIHDAIMEGMEQVKNGQVFDCNEFLEEWVNSYD